MTYRRLKEYLKDKNLLRAIERMIEIQKRADKNGMYGDKNNERKGSYNDM